MKFKLCEKCHEIMLEGQVCGNCVGAGKEKEKEAADPYEREFSFCPRAGGFMDDGHYVSYEQEAYRAKTAAEIVQSAADAISQRGTLRDNAAGERSMKRAVDSFNGLLGRDALTEQEGWLFMCVLKMARATAGKHHLDDYTDLAGYAGLAGECGELTAAANDDGEVMQFNKDYKHPG